MIIQVRNLFIILLFAGGELYGQLQSPESFFPHTWSESFTPHHLLVDYAHHIAENSPNIEVKEYGKTSEQRSLITLFISSAQNMEKLEEIRQQNLIRAGLMEGEITEDDISICWLSFGVHGNEAGSSESSAAVMYALADTSDQNIQEWLKHTIVILDPCINPDGYARYTNWVNSVSQRMTNPDPLDREHHEPWPGGRVNHYLFDLNRDWAWQTQEESRARIKLYNSWMPQIHVDFHEMYYHSSYYFAPAADPYHDYITDWQGDFQREIGQNNAKYFEKEGWLYFTREVFDLFYPSYGDTYPSFNGAIGMTYEQGGHSDAGREIQLDNNNILKLADRIEHHKTSALSTIEMAALHSKELVSEFEKYFHSDAPGQFKTYVIKSNVHAGRLLDICAFLDRQDIQYSTVGHSIELSGYSYVKRKNMRVKIEPGDMVISCTQPKNILLSVLMDPDVVLSDSLTYDITAWSVPYAYGMDAYAFIQPISDLKTLSISKRTMRGMVRDGYAYTFSTEDMAGQRLLAGICKAGIKSKVNYAPFSNEGKLFPRGTVLVTKAENKAKEDWSEILISLATDENVRLNLLQGGLSEAGPDLGSDQFKYIAPPKVLVMSGDDVSPYGFGQVWHYFENVIHYPLTIVEKDRAFNADLQKFNVVIIPEAYFHFEEEQLDILANWVSKGGKLIVMGTSLSNFANSEKFGLEYFTDATEEARAEQVEKQKKLEYRFHDYAEAQRIQISDMMPGAIIKAEMDATHPLGFGQDSSYFSLKTSSDRYALLSGGGNVAYVPKNAEYIGFAGSNVKEKLSETLIFGVEEKGAGKVIYMVDNPLFRGFWYNGMIIFGNAVFY